MLGIIFEEARKLRADPRTKSGYRAGLLAVLLAAAGAMLSGQIVHPLAQPRYDQGPVRATFRLGYIQMMFQQTAAQRQALDQLLAAQRDPSSPSYHNWLTPEQYADRFGLSIADLAQVTAWLRTSGFTIENTARGRDWIAFSGTAAQVAAAFHTSVHRYVVGSETHFAVATEPVIPSELTPLVATIFGLNDFYPKSMLKPAFTSASGVLASPSLAPGDLATIYDINPLYQRGVNGTGQKVVIVGRATGDASLLSDIQQFRSSYGLAKANIQFVADGTSPPNSLEDVVEADLDLEWAGAIAPDAALIYVYGVDANSAALYAIDQDIAPVVSESFGGCEAAQQPSAPSQYEAEAKKGNALGITWIAASGDFGAADCASPGATFASYGLAVNFPASVPEITAVGGAEFNEGNGTYWGATNGANGGSALGYIPEMAWNDTGALSDLCNYNGVGAAPCPALAATGGGVSVLFPKPSWQIGPGVPADGQRDVPDIALAASNLHDPYNIISAGQPIQVGGTSASTPVFAGMLALLNQELKGSGVGNINATLYGLALSSRSMFHDIVNNNNIVACACEGGDVGYNAGIAYDLTTGLGSVDTYNLVTGWRAATASGDTPVISSVANAASYAAGVVSPGEMVVISGKGLGPAQLGGLALTSSGFVSTQYSTNTLMSVQFNGFAAPIVYTSSTAIAVVVPYEVAGSTAQVTVTYQGRTSVPVTVSVAAAVPGIFTADATGGGQAAALNSDGRANSSATPATQGSTLVLYGTGAGQTSPEGVDGQLAAAPLPLPNLPVSVTIGGVPAGAQYAGAAYGEVAGVLQINAVVPPGVAGSALPVVVRVGNTVSQAGVTIAVAANPPFAITSQETVGSVVTNNSGALVCSAPPAKASFPTTQPVVWVYFTFNGAQNGDVIVANWLHPSGQSDADQPSLTLNYSGSGCAAAPLNIAGAEVAQDPGNWQVKIFRNGTFQFALPFTIGP